MQAPHVNAQKSIPQECLPACIGFVPGVRSHTKFHEMNSVQNHVINLRKLLPATGVIWALWAQSDEKSPERVPEACRPRRHKDIQKWVKKESTIVKKWVDFDLTCGPLEPRGSRNSFRTLFATLGPKGPNDPCSRTSTHWSWDLTCNRPVSLQSPGTPKPQKCILKSEECHFRPPEKRAPKVNFKRSPKFETAHFWTS